MKLDINVNVNFNLGSGTASLLTLIQQGIATMNAQLAALQAQVANDTTVEQSAITLISGLSSQLAAAIAAQKAGDDGAALQALADTLSTNNTALAAAVTANTPAAPAATDGAAPATT